MSNVTIKMKKMLWDYNWKNCKEYYKKNKIQVVLATILLLGIIGVACMQTAFWIDTKYREIVYREKVKVTDNNTTTIMSRNKGADPYINMGKNQKLVQRFRGEKGSIQEIDIRFTNAGKAQTTGKIIASIIDENGTVVAQTEMASVDVKHSDATPIVFAAPIELDSNAWYDFVLETVEFDNPSGFGLYVCNTIDESVKNKYQPTYDGLTIDDKETGTGNIQMTFLYNQFKTRTKVNMIFVLTLGMLLCLFPWRNMTKHRVWPARFLCAVSPFLAFFIVQRLSDYKIVSMIKMFFTWVGVFNIFLYGLIWLFLYVITNRAKGTSILMVTLVWIFGLANYFVWDFRGSPIVFSDVTSLGTAMEVVSGYQYVLDVSALWSVIYVVSFICVVIATPKDRGLSLRKRAMLTGGLVAGVLGFNLLFFHSDFIKNRGVEVKAWKPERNYAKNGSLLSFVLTWTYTQVEKPKGYSVERVEEIAREYPTDTEVQDASSSDMPNVICIMNETFGDLANVAEDLKLSEDNMPFIRNLTEDTVKGKLYVSIFGSNTANSEFEFLTGNSMAFLPYHSIAYNSYIKEKTANLTYNMKAQNYNGNIAFHPYKASGWNRPTVYDYMGFNTFLSESDVQNPEYLRSLVSDQSDYDQVISLYEQSKKESDEPFYIFNVTMQNHGGYTGDRGLIDTPIVINDNNLKDPGAEQYINLIKESDDAFKNLVNYFKKQDEKTVIVMFGDHLPKIQGDFYERLFGQSTDSLDIDQHAQMYWTPYVLWANYDIQEETKDMSANYLSAYMSNIIGSNLTGYQKYLLDLQKEIPILTADFYEDNSGEFHSMEEEGKDNDKINEYQILQYNNMFDEEHRVDDFFFLKDENE